MKTQIITFIISFLLLIQSINAAKSKYNNDEEDNPYEFGFTIDGQQHRHEKKDANGIIQGEFGFITADGIYHVTVYATDENGNFRILSMKNVRVSGPLDEPNAQLPDTSQFRKDTPKPAPPPPPPANPLSVNTAPPPAQAVTSRPNVAFTTQPTIKPACAGCGYVTLPPNKNGNKLPFQTPAFQNPKPGTVVIGNIPAAPQVDAPFTSPIQTPQSHPANGVPQNVQSLHPHAPTVIDSNTPAIQPFSPSNTQFANPPTTQQNNFSNNQQPSVGTNQNTAIQQDNFGGNQHPNNFPDNQNPSVQDNFGGNQTPAQQNNFPANQSPAVQQDTFSGHHDIQNPTIQPGNPIINQDNLSGNQGLIHNIDQRFPEITQDVVKPNPLAADNPSGITVANGVINVPNNPPIPIKDKFPGMTDGLPAGISTGDITDLLYKFNYTVGFHGHYEKGYKSGAKVGGYFVNDRDGVSRIVTYVADENGYRPKVKFIRLDLTSDLVPKEGSEKTFGLKNFEFVWYPLK